MSLREEQCKKVCRILDDVLANRPTERDSLIVAVRKAFESLEQFGNAEQLPSAQAEREKGKWIADNHDFWVCSNCKFPSEAHGANILYKFCPNCGADMRGEQE